MEIMNDKHWRINKLPSYGREMPHSSLDRNWACKTCGISLNIFELKQYVEIESGVFCPDCYKQIIPNLRKKKIESLDILK
jgi:hypothetical protein